MKRIPLPADIVSEILNASADATIISDRHGRISVVNQAAEQLFGYGPGELVGEPVEILLPDAMRQAHEGLRSDYHQAPRSRPMVSGLDIEGRHKDGSLFRA